LSEKERGGLKLKFVITLLRAKPCLGGGKENKDWRGRSRAIRAFLAGGKQIEL